MKKPYTLPLLVLLSILCLTLINDLPVGAVSSNRQCFSFRRKSGIRLKPF